jgi:hypothetical protein
VPHSYSYAELLHSKELIEKVKKKGIALIIFQDRCFFEKDGKSNISFFYKKGQMSREFREINKIVKQRRVWTGGKLATWLGFQSVLLPFPNSSGRGGRKKMKQDQEFAIL